MSDTTSDMPPTLKRHDQVGIWVDHRTARFVVLRGDDAKYSELKSGVESKHRATGGTRMPGKNFMKSFTASEKKRTRVRAEHIRQFYAQIVEALAGVGSVALLGPAGAKDELAKVINKDQTLKRKLVDVRTADKLTERQLVAAVRDIFH